VAWFGPKGFASVVYGLIVLESGAPRADEVFHLVAIVVVLSNLSHSSTDVPIAHYFARQREQARRADTHETLEGDLAGTHTALHPLGDPDTRPESNT
jgi:NhaP-type Na+/H+ or K+/H+ antiporter